MHRSGSERKGQKDEEKSLGRYVEDDWKQMLAAVKGEAERRDDNSESYLFFKDGETEIKWPSQSKRYFLFTFEEKNHEIKPSVCGQQGQVIVLHINGININIC